MTLLLRIFRSQVAWGVAIAFGVLVAIGVHGRLQFRDGFRQGKAAEASVRDSVQRIADVAAAQVAAYNDSVITALQAKIQRNRIELAQLREARALAVGQYHEALRQYEAAKAALSLGDSLPAMPPECDALASACTNAVRAAQLEADSLVAQLQHVEAVSAQKDTVIAAEPTRTAASNRQAVEMYRATRQEPSRTRWALLGAAAAAALHLLAPR